MMSKNIRNKIITLSGEPVSGKGTTNNEIYKKLLEQGFLEENIHRISTGDNFRKYTVSMIDIIREIINNDNLDYLDIPDYIRPIFNNKKFRDNIAKTIINFKNKNINLDNFTIKDANDSEEFSPIRDIIDKLIDEEIARQGKEINSEPRPNEVWIIDSRLAFHNIPEAFSVRLTTNSKIAGQRLYNDTSRGKEDNKYSSVLDAIEQREERKNIEIQRYIKKYNVNIADENNYDLIIDTSYSSTEDIANIILKCQKLYEEGKQFAKKWANPRIFLPLQSERDTLGRGISSGMTLEEIAEEINKNGYIPTSKLEVICVDDIYYIIEGHHRNFASAYIGNTLVPYEVIAHDEEVLPGSNITAKQRAKFINSNWLYGHEQFFDEKNKPFSYKDIYPDVYDINEAR